MFVSELRSLAEFCNYGGVLDDVLRDRLVSDINNVSMQRSLLAEKDLTFEKVHTIGFRVRDGSQQCLNSAKFCRSCCKYRGKS